MTLWIMVAAQLVVWAWFSIKGGKMSDKQFIVFTAGMLLGQLGAGIETFYAHAPRAFVVQVYFFIFTAVGGIQRFRHMQKMEA